MTRVIAPIVRRKKPAEATRVFEDLRGIIRWAVGQGHLDRNVIEGMEPPATSQPRDRTLSEGEIQILWNGLPKALARSMHCQRILKLCLATAQRVGEVAGIVPAELDLPAREWRLPAGRTKNGHAHTVPLSDLAISIIKRPGGCQGCLRIPAQGQPCPLPVLW